MTEAINIWEILSQTLVWTYFTIAMIKMYVIMNNRNDLASIIVQFEQLWPKTVKTSVEKEIVEGYMSANHKWMSRYAYLSISCFFVVNTTPIILTIYKLILGEKPERLLPFVTWFPFNEYGKVTYPLTYIFLFYGSHVSSAASICYDSLFCMFLSHLCLQYKLLAEDLRNTVASTKNNRDTNEISSEERLRRGIEKHQLLIDIRNNIDSIFTDVFFLNFSSSTFNICIVGFLFVIQKGFAGKVKFVMMLLTLLAQIFLLCWYGQEVVDNVSMRGGDIELIFS